MQIDIDLQAIIDKVERLTDEEVARAIQQINAAAPTKMKDRKKADKELAAKARQQLTESGQLQEFLRKAGIYDDRE